MNQIKWLGFLSLFLPALAMAKNQLDMAFIEVDSFEASQKLSQMNLDIANVRDLSTDKGRKLRYEVVLSAKDKAKLAKAGIKWNAVVAQAQAQARSFSIASVSDTVYHSFDEPELGIKDSLYKMAEDYPDLVSLYSIGETVQGRPMIMVKVGKKGWWDRWFDRGPVLKEHGDRSHSFGFKPEVLYVATHHAREWVATQMAMRYLKYLLENYGKDERVTKLLDTVDQWVMPVGNPDGYEYTFTDERLWRKNLADNDDDGVITQLDGVDLNRNFSQNWGLDDEGSSPIISDATYRGPEPESEPESRALVKFIKRHDFKFIISYHTYSNLILYPWGWQVQTPSFDDPIFLAQAGTDENPAIYDSIMEKGYDPGVSADLYTTNGEFTDYTYGVLGIPSYTVELTPGEDKEGNFYGFEFPDDEGMVQTVFEDNLEFALSLAESAKTPNKPVSPVGISADDIYHDALTNSWGSKQKVDILAQKYVAPWTRLVYQVDGGRWQLGNFKPRKGKTYNTEKGTYYSRYEATIRGQNTGSEVTYYIWSPWKKLGPYTYTVEQATSADVLIIAAEDYTGEYPVYDNNTAPNYLSYYTDALDGAGYSYDVWNVDERLAAPDYREILSHYDAVIWYTGDDYASTQPSFDIHEDMKLAIRDYLNYYDGKLLATGQGLSQLSTVFGNYSDDFFQYYLGSFIHLESSGVDGDGNPYSIEGVAGDPLMDGLLLELNGAESAGNQTNNDSFLASSGFLSSYDQQIGATYVRPGGGFGPTSGEYYVYSGQADQSYKRLGGTFVVPADNPTLTFNMAYETEADWDFAFVEISVAGSGKWTTLPEVGGATTRNTGSSCTSDWVSQLHPFLANYMDADCNPTGATGEWHSLEGSSAGFKKLSFDLSAYAGQSVELYISYASDWGTQGLGIFVDDVQLGNEPAEDFETDLGSWQATGPEGTFNINNWERKLGEGFVDGPVLRSDDTVYLGFGLEGVNGFDNRVELLNRSLKYLGL
ncbi:carboxypeptidase [Hahella sp. CCB-MM4]|uniref:M14 family metallopeptidase n=1 Tax=Hahella sp. (strain CCB-MM4) TaxID=1926491 RepID=UPI000B9B522E|nr:M14 family metallopeptidase [Hahella sp. CCB-MM4]OZG72311.1 carboxypeptidase [Hahella sp. CCB-MM4]